MNKREKIKNILSLKETATCGSWLGNPHEDTLEIYKKILSVNDLEGVQTHFDDDCRWLNADDCYKAPHGRAAFDFGHKKEHSMDGCELQNIETVAEVEALDWPDVKHLDFSDIFKKIDSLQDKAVLTGFWSPFFHDLADLMGMEEYFVKMYTHPEVVEAITTHVVDYYVAANEIFFAKLSDRSDTFFFGNDFGTQRDTLISIDCFKKFILPGFKRLINVAKKYDKKVILHSCGAISKVIPLLIDAGIDGLHPLQAKAEHMNPEFLFKEYGKDIAFMGGVDTQDLLVNAKPNEIYDEVLKLKELFGNHFIVSPSHEAILPNIPIENIEAMFEAIRRN